MNDLKKRILNIIKKPGLACLSTINEEGNPWCRYVIAVGFDDMTIRIATFLGSRKVQQIKNNPEVHLACGVPNAEHTASYLQIQGKAEISTDKAEKKAFWNEELAQFFKSPDDPEYVILIIKPYRIEHWEGMSEPEIWKK